MCFGRINKGRVKKGELFKHLLGLEPADEGDPDGVFVNNIYPFNEAAGEAVIIFRESEFRPVDLVQYFLNGIGGY